MQPLGDVLQWDGLFQGFVEQRLQGRDELALDRTEVREGEVVVLCRRDGRAHGHVAGEWQSARRVDPPRLVTLRQAHAERGRHVLVRQECGRVDPAGVGLVGVPRGAQTVEADRQLRHRQGSSCRAVGRYVVGGEVDVTQTALGQLGQHREAPDVYRRPLRGPRAVLECLCHTALRTGCGDPVDNDGTDQQRHEGRGDDPAPPPRGRGARAYGAAAVAALTDEFVSGWDWYTECPFVGDVRAGHVGASGRLGRDPDSCTSMGNKIACT